MRKLKSSGTDGGRYILTPSRCAPTQLRNSRDFMLHVYKHRRITQHGGSKVNSSPPKAHVPLCQLRQISVWRAQRDSNGYRKKEKSGPSKSRQTR